MSIFSDRADAGRQLAADLMEYASDDTIILALPRGGVPVAAEVARRLRVPLDVFVVRKVGVPGHEELAMGAIASGGVRVVNEEVIRELQIPEEVFAAAANLELQELSRREDAYRGGRLAPTLSGRTVILVDDGLATGSTMLAAVQAVRAQHPQRLVVAVPVAAESTCEQMKREADEVICHATPKPFGAVGAWYDDFSQTTDEEVRDLLQQVGAGDRHANANR